MPTPTFVEGYEHQQLCTSAIGSANTYFVPARPAGLTFITGRNGLGYALHVVEDGSTATMYNVGLPNSQTYVGSLYFRVSAAPSIDSILCAVQTASTINAIFRIIAADSKISCKSRSGTAVAGPVVVDGLWHRLDFSSIATGTTWTVTWAVDGVAQTNATIGSQVATNQTGFYVGSQTAADTLTADFDDIVLSVTGADYPMGAHHVRSVVPNADGTHAPGTSVKTGGSVVDASTNTAWDKLDDWPTGVDAVLQDAVDTNAYAEINYENTTYTTIWGVSQWWVYVASSTAVAHHASRLYDASTNLLGSGGGTFSATVAAGKNLMHHLNPAPGGGWDTDFNGLKARIGYSSDATSPNPTWQSLMLQYAVNGEPVFGSPMGFIPI